MKVNRVFLIFFLLLLVFPSWGTAKGFHGRVIKVFDGDTLLVRIQGRKEYVRLREIDAPEISRPKQAGQEPWGKKAGEFALSRVRDKAVWLEIEEREERDHYHRLLAYVFVGNGLINQEMIQSGNAFFYGGPFRGRHARWLEKAEKLAREKEIGVWDAKNGLKERPWEFRCRTQRGEGLFSQPGGILGGEKRSPPSRGFSVPPDKVVGNKRSMIYYPAGSTGAASVIARNRVLFDSPGEAEKAGFHRARSSIRKSSSFNQPKKLTLYVSSSC